MDTMLHHINKMKIVGTNLKWLKWFPIKAEVILVIPYSNTELERLFKIVRKTRYNSRFSLKMDGTLSSILAMKSKYPESVIPYHRFQPGSAMTISAKYATTKALNNRD